MISYVDKFARYASNAVKMH